MVLTLIVGSMHVPWKLIGGKWKPVIIGYLGTKGTKRYSETSTKLRLWNYSRI